MPYQFLPNRCGRLASVDGKHAFRHPAVIYASFSLLNVYCRLLNVNEVKMPARQAVPQL